MTHRLYVYLGRFAPLHLGHQSIIDKMVQDYGMQNCLILIGSSNSYNSRTPYTFEERKEIIRIIYPELNLAPLPDAVPDLEHYDGSTNQQWLKQLELLESSFGKKFVFVGGSKEDLEVLSERFETTVLVNRNIQPDVCATNARLALRNNDTATLKKLLDPRIIQLAVSGFANYAGKS